MRHSDSNGVYFLHFILIVHLKNTSALFVVSNSNSSWKNAAQAECVLATPNISYHGKNYQIDSTDIPEDIHEPVWIGYYKKTTAFEYVDCIKINTLLNGRRLKTTVSKPSECFPDCERETYVGVTVNNTQKESYSCFCLEEYNRSESQDGCKNECQGLKGVACGSKGYVSVYRVARHVIVSDENAETNCLSKDQKEMKWIDCKVSLEKTVCEKENVSIDVTDKHKKWIEASQKCFEGHLRPLSYNVATAESHETLFWTGVFKSDVVYTRKSLKPFTSREQYGYIENSSGILKFDKDIQRKMLCNTVTPHTSTLSTEVTEAFHTQSTQPSDKLNIKQGDETGANIIVPVVVPVAIVLLIFVIALIFICIKRKHKLKLDSQTKEISNSKQYVASYSCSHAHGADEHFLDETGTPDAMSPYYMIPQIHTYGPKTLVNQWTIRDMKMLMCTTSLEITNEKKHMTRQRF